MNGKFDELAEGLKNLVQSVENATQTFLELLFQPEFHQNIESIPSNEELVEILSLPAKLGSEIFKITSFFFNHTLIRG